MQVLNLNPEFIDFVKTEKDDEIIRNVENLSHFLKLAGHSVAPFSQLALNKFKTFTEEKKQKTIDQLAILNQLLTQSDLAHEVEIPLENDEQHPERKLVEQAMKFYNLKLKDDFWKTVQPHDILEIYNDEGIQVFRTFNFFNASSYSLTDLLVNEWFVLWDRPKFVLQRIFEYSNGILSGEMKGVHKMDIPKHVVKEIYSSVDQLEGFIPRSTLVEFGNICALFNSKDNKDSKVRGIIVSSKAYPNTLGEEETKKVIVF